MNSKPEISVTLRKFPYPYKAMFAICSDVDHAISLSAYVEFMKYLNTEEQTAYGWGVGLEVSNSFWFFNATGDNQLSYFHGLSKQESDFASVCRELWESGHIDTLHSYGNFDTGGFERKYAEMAMDELEKQSRVIPVWVNHGNDNNHQKIGPYPNFNGAQPDSTAYHFDLLKQHGTSFFWAGRTTHVCGQNANPSLNHQAQQLLQVLVLKTKYRNTNRPLPDPANHLLIPTKMADGNELIEFQRFISRYGEVKNTDLNDLGVQLKESNLSALVKSGGYMLLYTHMNENLPEGQPLPETVDAGFRRLAKYSHEKDLLVTTNSRLLQYADVSEHLSWKASRESGITQLKLFRDDKRPLSPGELQGLTFYCPNPESLRLYCGDTILPVQVNPADSSGKSSVSVIWEALQFPT